MLNDVIFSYNFLVQKFNKYLFSKLNDEYKEKYKEKKMRKIVKYAKENSIFYADLYESVNTGQKIDVSSLPIITKKDIVDNFERILTTKNISKKALEKYFSTPFDFEKRFRNKYLAFHTSGSTGNPLFIIWNESVFGLTLSNYFYEIKKVCNIKDAKKLRVAYIGITDDYVGGNSWVYSMKKYANIKIISIFSKKEKILAELNDFMPDIIFTKPSLLGELARKQKEGLLKIHPKKMIFAGEMMSPVDLKCIRQYFNINPINSYSTCESGPVALQSNKRKDGLSIFEEMVNIELVDDDNNIINDYYKEGNIVITNYYNKDLPIIRYKIGDRAYFIPSEKTYRNRLLSYIQGRGTSFFSFKDFNGHIVKVSEFPFWSLYIPGIIRYEVIQKSYTELTVNIESDKTSVSDYNNLINTFKEKINRILKPYKLEKSIKIYINKVEEIKPNKAGKIQITKPLREL